MRFGKFLAFLALFAFPISMLLAAPADAAPSEAGGADTYIVLYGTHAVPANAATIIKAAGGTLVYSYSQIGVIIARSSNTSFAATLLGDRRIEGVSRTSGFATQIGDVPGAADTDASVTATPAPGSDPLSGLQWDMDQIQAPAARAINGGSPSVIVGDLDTGLDYTHPDLAPNVDFTRSVSCVGGVPNQDPAAWMDDNGHGTHTAGIIAAAKNGIGIVGVAPNVKIAGIKVGDKDGFFYPEAVVCAFMWAGSHGIAVTNNSYFADPWLFNCKNDPEQRAIWKAEQRAIRYAQSQGVTVVAINHNFADDLAHPTRDVTSPDNTTPVMRDVTNACIVLPVEIPGVIGVSADGNSRLKSFYSSYGVGVTQVVAPGGDSVLQQTAAAPNGRVLSTWPAALAANCPPGRAVTDSGALYCYLQGTSMAAPHVAGVAALIVSMGLTAPPAVAARITNTADPMDCPVDPSIYEFFPSINNGAPQVCQGGPGYNGFYGHGQVNALSAVTTPR
jgi:hypothetical protein